MGIIGLPAQGVVACAERAADYDRYLGHDGITNGVYQLCTAPDDPALLCIATDHKACDILEENNGKTRLIAVHHKAGRFVRTIGIDNSPHLDAFLFCAGLEALTCNNPDGASGDSAISGYESFAVVRPIFVKRVRIYYRSKKFSRVIGLISVEAHQIVNSLGFFCRSKALLLFFRFLCCHSFWQKSDQRTKSFQAGRIILLVKIHRAADFRMHFCAAKLLGIGYLANGCLYERWTCKVKT